MGVVVPMCSIYLCCHGTLSMPVLGWLVIQANDKAGRHFCHPAQWQKQYRICCKICCLQRLEVYHYCISFFVVRGARWNNLSFILKEMCEYVPIHWNPKNATNEASPWNLWGFFLPFSRAHMPYHGLQWASRTLLIHPINIMSSIS